MKHNIKDNFNKMPVLLKGLSLLGVLAPLLSAVSVYTGSIDAAYQVNVGNVALNGYEVIGVVLFSIPIFIASCSMIVRSKMSRWGYIFGWFIVCMSPLFLPSVRSNMSLFIIEFLFYFAIGVCIWFYLFRNRGVKFYFSR